MRAAALLFALLAVGTSRSGAQGPPGAVRADSVSASFADAELRNVLLAMARYLDKPLLQSGVPSVRVSLETPAPIPRTRVLPLLRGLVQAHGLEIVEDSAFYRVQPRPAEPQPAQVAPVPAPQPGAQGGIQLFVIRLRHARAADVAATVDLLFGGQGQFAGGGGLSGGTLSDELRRGNVPPAGTPPAGAGQAGPAAAQGRGASLTGPVTIVPDEITNSLLVRALPQDFAVLRQAVDELDIRPLQVLIEVLIVEARTDRSFDFGTDLFAPQQRVGDQATVGGSLSGAGLGDLVVKVMNLSSANINATINLAVSRGNARIVSRPVLLASNNMEARLLVGSQRPFVQVSRSLPTDAPSRDQVVQYRDVGTKLLVRPTINHDGYVSLLIQQEVNAATSETQFDAPIISTREAATRVLVRDSQTIVLGGLRDTQRDSSSGGIPLLSSLPLLGGFFGRQTGRATTTELYLFLTPRILRTDDDADGVTRGRLPRDLEP